MEHTIKDNTSREPMHELLAHALIRQIRSKKLRSGDRIPSERELAQNWYMSRGTARLALKRLEDFGYIERRGAHGSFVLYESPPEQSLRVVLAFPEESISLDTLFPENWAFSSELFRGLFAGASRNGVQFFFEHFQDQIPRQQLTEQLRRLHQYDAAIFVGQQLDELQIKFAADHTVIQVLELNTRPVPPGVAAAGFDRYDTFELLLEHILECGADTVGALSFDFDDRVVQVKRAKDFLEAARKKGLRTPTQFNFHFSDTDTLQTQFDAMLAKPLPDFLFCNHSEKIIDFYQAAARNQVAIGTDIMVAGIATGLTFKGLLPSYTHVRIPMFEIGLTIMDVLAKNPQQIVIPAIKPKLIIGNSTHSLPQTTKQPRKEKTYA